MDSNIGDDEAFVVKRKVAVDGLWKHAIMVVEEEDEKKDDKSEETELDARSNLKAS